MKRNTLIGTIAAAALFAAVIATSLPASACVKYAGGEVDYVTSYIWRGMDTNPENDPAIQPAVNFTLPYSLDFGIWASYGFAEGLHTTLDEVDFTISKSGAFSPFIEWTVGHTYYTFPAVDQSAGAPRESNESFVGVSFPKLPLKPAINLYVDYETGDGVYGSLSGTYEFPFGISKSDPPMTLGLNLGYSDGPWGTEPGLGDISATLSAPFKIRGFVLTPSLNYSIAPDERVNTDDEIWLGLNFAF
ncbi:MAG: TorF family putative porin [bacterium]